MTGGTLCFTLVVYQVPRAASRGLHVVGRKRILICKRFCNVLRTNALQRGARRTAVAAAARGTALRRRTFDATRRRRSFSVVSSLGPRVRPTVANGCGRDERRSAQRARPRGARGRARRARARMDLDAHMRTPDGVGPNAPSCSRIDTGYRDDSLDSR